MNLHSLETTPGSRKNRHRVGRGDGSGWGGTCGRGEKGQRSRSGAAVRHDRSGGRSNVVELELAQKEILVRRVERRAVEEHIA